MYNTTSNKWQEVREGSGESSLSPPSRQGRAEVWASQISPSASFVTSLPMFPSLASGSGYQLFNYFQIVELGSGLNKSH